MEPSTLPPAQIDHLVVAARSLDEAVQWCETTLGVTPGPGGEHPLMGTHNRLLNLASAGYPTSYLELIAINPIAPDAIPARAGRWFDLDSPVLQAALAERGPQLVHFVASVPSIGKALSAWAAQGIDRGPALAASRQTARGLLQWQISVRDDGQRLMQGCLPTLIEWNLPEPTGSTSLHPSATLPPSGLALLELVVTHPQADPLRRALAAIGLAGVSLHEGAPNLAARLQTPLGVVTLSSQGI